MIEDNQVHCMLDLETLGTGSDSAIVSIGAVLFSIKEGIIDRIQTPINFDSVIKNGFSVTGNTIKWWLEQSEEARKELTKEEGVDIHLALGTFTNFLKGYEDVLVWGNGATFDNVILKNAYTKLGYKIPWSYRGDMCYRTIRQMYPQVSYKRVGVYHKAVDDAETQALHLIEILKYINSK